MKRSSHVPWVYRSRGTLRQLSRSSLKDCSASMHIYITHISSTLCCSQRKHISTPASNTLSTSLISSLWLKPRNSHLCTNSSNNSKKGGLRPLAPQVPRRVPSPAPRPLLEPRLHQRGHTRLREITHSGSTDKYEICAQHLYIKLKKSIATEKNIYT